MEKTGILILGVNGMLGHKLFSHLSKDEGLSVRATTRRSADMERWFGPALCRSIVTGVDASDLPGLERTIAGERPGIVINCIGIIKQLKEAHDEAVSTRINTELPHALAGICGRIGARLIHISTDCVFSGKKGMYTEDDPSDVTDIYGRTKRLGEVSEPHCITLRTSIIGHELDTHYGLVEWFLSQQGKVKGFTRAIYTGFPTIEFSRIVARHVIPNADLHGVYHVSSDPISKYALLQIVARRYRKEIEIEADSSFFCDRSLDSSRFRTATGYTPPSWDELVERMHNDYLQSPCYRKDAHVQR